MHAGIGLCICMFRASVRGAHGIQTVALLKRVVSRGAVCAQTEQSKKVCMLNAHCLPAIAAEKLFVIPSDPVLCCESQLMRRTFQSNSSMVHS